MTRSVFRVSIHPKLPVLARQNVQSPLSEISSDLLADLQAFDRTRGNGRSILQISRGINDQGSIRIF